MNTMQHQHQTKFMTAKECSLQFLQLLQLVLLNFGSFTSLKIVCEEVILKCFYKTFHGQKVTKCFTEKVQVKILIYTQIHEHALVRQCVRVYIHTTKYHKTHQHACIQNKIVIHKHIFLFIEFICVNCFFTILFFY